MPDAIVVKNISKAFRSEGKTVHALDKVSLSVKQGELFGLLGPNGAGKTTLTSILAGIIIPDSGQASILGLDCLKQTKKVQARINVVSGFTGVPASLTCYESLNYYCMLYNVKNKGEKIDEVMKQTDIEEIRDTLVEDVSSGMRQRYMVARALLNTPEVLILDEPTVGLDVESAINIRNLIKNLHKAGMTIVLTTHNMFEAEALCERISFINYGKIVAEGTPSELKGKIISENIVEINCSDAKEAIKIISGIEGTASKIHANGLIRVRVDSYGRLRDIMREFSKSRMDVYSVSALEPTFEETYLKLIKKGKKHA